MQVFAFNLARTKLLRSDRPTQFREVPILNADLKVQRIIGAFCRSESAVLITLAR